MKLTREQYDVLLKPLAAHRISQRKQGGATLSYLEAWDVKAHLIRVFGFGGWSADVISADIAFEDQDDKGRWNVGYKVVMRLRIHGQEGDLFGDTTYTEAAIGSSTQPSRGEAHDMAVKTAESDALKRAAINLGTQFGLSLYDSGNRQDVIGHTLRPPSVEMPPPAIPGVPIPDFPNLRAVEPEVTLEEVEPVMREIEEATDEDTLKEIYDRLTLLGWLDFEYAGGVTPRSLIVDRVNEIRGR